MAKKKETKKVELKEVSRVEINGNIIITYEDGSVKIIPAPIMLTADQASEIFGSEEDEDEEEEEESDDDEDEEEVEEDEEEKYSYFNPNVEIKLSDARKIDKTLNVGDTIDTEVTPKDFGLSLIHI